MAQVGRIFLSVSETPQERAKVIIDPTHPEAGRGGVVPPVHSRIQPGQALNPGGRPKGASVQAALLRELARKPDEDGIGEKAREIAEALIAVAKGERDPSEVDVKAALAILDRTDGPVVKERVQTNIQLEEGITLEERRRAT